ncbi:COR domain-containing protein [Planctellipticum variicoloris]|uniref:leucine-rich repeat domain-containing protein n=1 Tax=Planctellipticum variicoloris TaxID=3064265 RepID=UPI003013CC59|nr:GTP-binding protein [Planctomycetaceae bacterium SH412]
MLTTLFNWVPTRFFGVCKPILDEEAGALASLTNLTSLILSNNNVGTEGARALASLTNLTSLDLRRNCIGVEGARALASLTNLTSLNLNNNEIGDEGARALASLTNLTSLKLNFNSVGPEGARALASLANLTSLELSFNSVGSEGARLLASLTNLTSLSLDENGVGDEGARALASLTNLTSLDLWNNGVGSEGARALASLTKLTSLSLNDNHVGDEGARALASLTNLEVLDLWRNGIGDEGARALASLTNLTSLDLWGNGVGDEGARALASLKNLEVLDLWNNGVGDEGARALASLTNLASLYLSDNGLGAEGARALASLTNLNLLHLNNNSVGDEGASALASLTNLTSLNLGINGIGDNGACSLALLTNLTSLELWGNSVGSVGARALASLTNLTSLGLNGNKIGDEGARSLSSLAGLTSLSLADNGVRTEGARALSSLTNLTSLNLNNNSVGDEGARALASLSNLTSLSLSDNSLGAEGARTLLSAWADSTSAVRQRILDIRRNGDLSAILPPEVLDQLDAQAILAAFRRFRSELRTRDGLQPLNEAKLLVLGNEAVGKTSLIRFLVDNEPRNQDEPKTPRAQIREKIETKDWSVDGCPVTLHVWDFGGQEIMHGTHRFFLTERSLYLVVLEARREDDRSVYGWLKTIRNRGGDSPIIVVVNKCDPQKRHVLQLNERELAEQYGVAAFLQTSCNDDDESRQSIATLRARIAAILKGDDRLKHVRDPMPRSYLRIKYSLAEVARNRQVLRTDEFIRLCEQAPVEDTASSDRILEEAEQRGLLKLLHDLGTVVAHGVSRDAPAALREITLLDPNWLTVAIYTLLTNPVVRDQLGEVRRSQLSEWLDPQLYPEERHEFILDMMQHPDVGLMFELPGHSREKYLIPEALPKNEPDYGIWPQDSLHFRFQYEFLPPGLIPRFIVQSHRNLSDQPTRWYTGVVLQAAGCPILVRGYRDKQRIDISVAGPNGQRRAALNVILNDLEYVHRLNSEIQPVARVPLPDRPELSVSYDYLLRLERSKGAEFTFLPEDGDREYKVRELLDGVRWERRVMGDEERESRLIGHHNIRVSAGDNAHVTVVSGGEGPTTMNGAPASHPAEPWWKGATVFANWPMFSIACGLGAVALAIVIWLLPNNESRAIVGGLAGVFLLVTGIVASWNPINVYRWWLCYVIPGGFLVQATGFTMTVWGGRGESSGGFRWDNSTSGWFFVAWALVVSSLIAGDVFTRRESGK